MNAEGYDDDSRQRTFVSEWRERLLAEEDYSCAIIRWRYAMGSCAGRCCLHDFGTYFIRFSFEDGMALFMPR